MEMKMKPFRSVILKNCRMYDDCQLTVIHGDDHCYTRHLDQVLDAITVFLNRVR